MMNAIWGVTVILCIGYVLVGGKDAEGVANSLARSGEQAIALTLGLAGTVAFWSGINRIAEKAGLIKALARVFRPIFVILFPSLRSNEPILSLIVSNVCATLFGLGNAATPLGLEAMRVMQAGSLRKDTATDAMCTLIVLNTTGVTLFPATLVGIRLAAGSENPMAIIGVTLLASLAGLVVGLIADRALRRYFRP
ncbi:MAG: spore maturation protein [Peptococcaceae bacterium]|nr:spore maturation protein [Peptococcaceae bacterium]